jgi:Zn finger protein HypA/HybF involved in hydrogenase expression
MGTNFFVNNDAEENEQIHIGRRSAAGLYCWDCNITLCASGDEGIHYSKNRWHVKCPKCGRPPVREKLSDSAAGRELGFNKKPANKKGVGTCCSFSWAIMPHRLTD